MDTQPAKKILLVEDEAIIALATKMKLQKYGYLVDTVYRGEEAVHKAVTDPSINLILMDIDLGRGIDGTEAARQILAKRPLPIVFWTSHGTSEFVEKVKSIARYGYILKNSGDFVLQSTVEMAFELFQAHEKTRRSEQLYATTLQSIGDAVISTDIAGRVVNMNSVAEKLTGWALADAHQMPLEKIFKIINEETRQAVENPVSKVLREGTVVGLANHTLLISRDGREIPIADSGAPILDIQRQVIGVVLVFRDQTEEREHDRQIAESEKKYKDLFESINIAFARHEIIIDDDCQPIDFIFLDANSAYEKITLLKREEIIGRRGLDVIPSLEPKWIEIYGRVALTGEPKTFIDHSDYLDKYWEVHAFSPGPNQFAVAFTDVTARLKTQKDLEAKNEFIQAVLDNLPIGVAINRFDDGTATYLNRKFEEIYGWPEEIIKDVSVFFEKVYPDPAYRNQIKDRVMADIATKDPGRMHWENIQVARQDGSIAIVNAANIPLLKQNMMISTVIDITALKKAEQDLRTSEERYRRVVEDQPGLVCRFSPDGQLTFVNPTYCQYFQRMPEELLGRTVEFLIPEEDRDRGIRPYTTITMEQLTATYQHRVIAGDGQIRWMEWTDRALFDEQQQIVEFQSVGFDITRRKAAEEALQKSEARLKTAEQIAGLGHYEIDFRTKNVFWSEGTHAIFGIEESQKPKDFKESLKLVHPEDCEKVTRKFEDSVRGKTAFELSYRIVRADGKVRHVHSIGHIRLDKNQEISRMFGTIQDITEAKHKENALKLANDTKDKFFSIIAQDMKELTQAMVRGTGLLEEHLRTGDDAFIREMSYEVHQTSEKLSKLLQNLLIWSQFQMGAMPFQPDHHHLRLMIEYLRQLLQEMAGAKNIRVSNAIDDEIRVFGDYDMLHILFRNLLTNAIKFTNPGGHVEISGRHTDDRVEITVHDNGVGISEPKIQRLFKVGAKNITTPGTANEKGSGLGLILCKEFIDKHGGQIRVESTPDQGSTFRVTLPNPGISA